MTTFDKFEHFNSTDVDHYISSFTDKIQPKNVNLFLIELFSSSLSVDNFYTCDLESLKPFYKWSHGEELKKSVLEKFLPQDNEKIQSIKKTNEYIDFVANAIFNKNLETEDYYLYLIHLADKMNLTQEQYNDYFNTLIEYLESYSHTWKNKIFHHINFSKLTEDTIHYLMVCVDDSIQLYDKVMEHMPEFKFSDSNAVEFIQFLMIEKHKPEFILDFIQKHNYEHLLNHKSVQSYCMMSPYQAKILKLAQIDVHEDRIEELIFNMNKDVKFSTLMRNLNSYFGKDYVNDYWKKKLTLNSKEQIANFFDKFITLRQASKNHMAFLDMYYEHFVPYGCPFALLQKHYGLDKNTNVLYEQQRNFLALLEPHLLVSEKRMLEFKMQASQDVVQAKRIKI